MAEATSALTSLSFKTEGATYGVKSTGSLYYELRYESEDVRYRATTSESDEIVSSRQPGTPYRTDVSVGGTVTTPFIYGVHDELYEWVFLGQWNNACALQTNAAVSATFNNPENTITGAGVGTGIVAGAWIYVTGAATAANNGFMKVTTSASGSLTVVGTTLIDEGPVSVTIKQGAGLSISTANTGNASFTLARHMDDIDKYLISVGCLIDRWRVEGSADSKILQTFELLAKTQETAAAHPGTGVSAVSTRAAMNAVDHIEKIMIGTTVYEASAFSWEIGNNLRTRKVMGTLGAKSVGLGSASVSGSLTVYTENVALLDDFFNFTARGVAICFMDQEGNKYVFDAPRAIFSDGGAPVTGKNTDLITTVPWLAYQDDTEADTGGTKIAARLQRFAA